MELAVVAGVVIAVLAVIAASGRISLSGGAVEEAARNAARAASISRDAYTAGADARAEAVRTLDEQDLQCASISVDVDTSGFAVPVGEPASVSAEVTCTVRLSDLGMPMLPATRTMTASSASALDTYRARQ